MRHRVNRGKGSKKSTHRPQRKDTKHRSRRLPKYKRVAPRTAEEFFAKSKRFQDRWTQATHVISRMRADGVSLRRASKEFGLDPRTAVRWAKAAMRKRPNGRYAAKPRDTLLRILIIPLPEALREIALRDSRQASELGSYWAAVQKYIETGDASALQQFTGKRITDADGVEIPLLTDLPELDRLASEGEFSFESIYRK